MGKTVFLALAIMVSTAAPAPAAEPEPASPAKQAGALAQEFVGLLKPRLKQAARGGCVCRGLGFEYRVIGAEKQT